jgi:hypothetical protein
LKTGVIKFGYCDCSQYICIVKLKQANMELTEQEKELIEQIRNYKNAKHNPLRTLRILIIELFYILLDD